MDFQSKNASVFSNLTKSVSSFLNGTKNSSTLTNSDRSSQINPLWSTSVFPWALALPWQYAMISYSNQSKNSSSFTNITKT